MDLCPCPRNKVEETVRVSNITCYGFQNTGEFQNRIYLRPHTATREKEKRKVIEDFRGFPGDRGVLRDMT
jgi:hypothetical protein